MFKVFAEMSLFSSYLKTTIRNIARNKTFSAITTHMPISRRSPLNGKCCPACCPWAGRNEDLSVEALFTGRPSKEKQKSDKTKPPVLDESALVEGRLMEVNWACGTAELHYIPQRIVPLRFDPVLNDDMRRLATQYVEIRGRGRFNDNDEWDIIYVEQITDTRSWSEAFDLKAFRNNPNPKIFDPEKVVTVSEPFDVDEFIRIIREGRDAG